MKSEIYTTPIVWRQGISKHGSKHLAPLKNRFSGFTYKLSDGCLLGWDVYWSIGSCNDTTQVVNLCLGTCHLETFLN